MQSPKFRAKFGDDYVMHVRAGEVVTIDMVCEPGTPLDPYLHPRDKSGNVLGRMTTAARRSACGHAELRLTAPAAGVYTVAATRYEISADTNDTIDPNADCSDSSVGHSRWIR